MTKAQSPRTLASQFGWRVWPGTALVAGTCGCEPSCSFTAPHPLGSNGEPFGFATSEQIESAWAAYPDAAPLLLADVHVDLVGMESEAAERVLDYLADNRRLARPAVVSDGLGVFLVAPAELHRWREYVGYGRGVRLLPWVPLPKADYVDSRTRWIVPPTPTNSSPLPCFRDLAEAFAVNLARLGDR